MKKGRGREREMVSRSEVGGEEGRQRIMIWKEEREIRGSKEDINRRDQRKTEKRRKKKG